MTGVKVTQDSKADENIIASGTAAEVPAVKAQEETVPETTETAPAAQPADDGAAKTTVIKSSGKKTSQEKAAEHREKMLRTAIASFMGMAAGIISFMLIGDPVSETGEPRAILGWLIMLAGIVFQKHVFMIMKIDYSRLAGKDWFYQAFMAFAFWFISWTILLSL